MKIGISRQDARSFTKNVLFEHIKIFYNPYRSHSFPGFNYPGKCESNSLHLLAVAKYR